jgi:hypothetical protein
MATSQQLVCEQASPEVAQDAKESRPVMSRIGLELFCQS